jgi:molybdopterin-guanine dinucleotide biosynthesis protein A
MTTLTLLCGGQSRRMGQDKALLDYHGETLLARHLRLAHEAGLPVQLASGDTAYPVPPEVRRIADALPGHEGPLSALAGALAAIAENGGTETLLLPVDTLVTPAQLRDALAGAAPDPFVCIVHDGQPQPLFARASVTLLPRLTDWLTNGLRRMMPLAALSGVRYVTCPADWPQPLNANTPEDWNTLCHHSPT